MFGLLLHCLVVFSDVLLKQLLGALAKSGETVAAVPPARNESGKSMPVNHFGGTKLCLPSLQGSWCHQRSLSLGQGSSEQLVALCSDFQVFGTCFREPFVFFSRASFVVS
jgi:hypothetical protein